MQKRDLQTIFNLIDQNLDRNDPTSSLLAFERDLLLQYQCDPNLHQLLNDLTKHPKQTLITKNGETHLYHFAKPAELIDWLIDVDYQYGKTQLPNSIPALKAKINHTHTLVSFSPYLIGFRD